MDLEVKPLSQALREDYLRYFDNVAFTDNPEWAGCYCYFYLLDHSREDWEVRTAVDNRAAVEGLITRGGMHGYLAYLDGAVVGWCHAGPKTCFPLLVQEEALGGPDVETTGSIVCFNVAPGQRRQGIASALLEAAGRGLAALGMTVAEAYPREGAATEAGHYHGPLQMYLRAGFTVHQAVEDYLVVRKALAPGEARVCDGAG